MEAPRLRLRLPFLLLVALVVSPPAVAAAASRMRIEPLPTAALRRLYDTSNYGKLQLNNGLALTPQMGWNSWNFFACNINETVIRDTADALVSTGLADLGYNYDQLLPDPKTFPSGIKDLADYVHGKGLKLGIYSDAGIFTCQVRPGSLHHEKDDAAIFASWGVDYLKYDNCYNLGIKPKDRYPPMRDALNSTGRQIFYSLCEWGQDDPALWAGKVGNSWRTTDDIQDTWKRITSGHHMLDPVDGMAPLLIGCDVRNMTKETMEILSNKEVIQVNQDPLGVQGRRILGQGKNGCQEVWAGPLSGNRLAVVLWNRCEESANIIVKLPSIGLDGSSPYSVRDLWKHETLSENVVGTFGAQVDVHDCKMYIFTLAVTVASS
uniref:Alpha-galactosidase n=1 Tax=Oryza nivara TaxID=4536 RepID=A0A0E0I5Q4_ORYNI